MKYAFRIYHHLRLCHPTIERTTGVIRAIILNLLDESKKMFDWGNAQCKEHFAHFALSSSQNMLFFYAELDYGFLLHSCRNATVVSSQPRENATFGSARSARSRNSPRWFRIRTAIPCAITKYERRRLCR